MKYLLFFVLLNPVFEPSETAIEESLNGIINAISSGDASTLSNFFASNIEIEIMDKEDTFSKAKATKIISNFFNKTKPQKFYDVHNGVSKGKDGQYCIGNLITTNSKFRVYMYIKTQGGRQFIHELRFSKI